MERCRNGVIAAMRASVGHAAWDRAGHGVGGACAGTEGLGRDPDAATGPANLHVRDVEDGRFKISRVGAPRRLPGHLNHPGQRAAPAALHLANQPRVAAG